MEVAGRGPTQGGDWMSEADAEPSASASASAQVSLHPSDSSPDCAPEANLSPVWRLTWLVVAQFVEQVSLTDNVQIWLLVIGCFIIGFASACQPSRQTPRQSDSRRDEVTGGGDRSGDFCGGGGGSVAQHVAPATAACPEQRPPPHGKETVRHLLGIHRDAVEKLRVLVSTHPHFKAERHDSLWLLRYLLSHKLRVPAAAAAARSALQIRHERGLDEIAHFVRTQPPSAWPHFATIRPIAVIEMLSIRPPSETRPETAAWDVLIRGRSQQGITPVQAYAAAQAAYKAQGGIGVWESFDRGFVEVGLLSEMQMHELWPLRQELEELTTYSMEWLFQYLDEATRRTDTMVKLTRMLSVEGLKLWMLNLKLARWDAQNKDKSQDLYPQLQDQMFFVNPPKAMLWAWAALVRPLLPKRVAERTHLVDTSTPDGLAVIEKACRLRSLPTFLGGSVQWPIEQNGGPVLPIGPQTFGEGGTFLRYD